MQTSALGSHCNGRRQRVAPRPRATGVAAGGAGVELGYEQEQGVSFSEVARLERVPRPPQTTPNHPQI